MYQETILGKSKYTSQIYEQISTDHILKKFIYMRTKYLPYTGLFGLERMI